MGYEGSKMRYVMRGTKKTAEAKTSAVLVPKAGLEPARF